MIRLRPAFASKYQGITAVVAAVCGTLVAVLATLLPSAGWAQTPAAGVVAGQTPDSQTPAGTPIVNTAGLRFDLAGASQSTVSNTVTIIVAERLDVSLVRNGQGGVVVAPQPTAVPLTLTNMDNGDEAFVVAASVASAQGAVPIALRMLAIDVDRDGVYDPAKDLPPVDGKTPVLAPGQSIALLAMVAATPGAASASATAALTVTAQSTTGSGRTGTDYAGMGDGGSDAVVGPTGAIARVAVPLSTALAGPALFKSQSVRAADGSPNAVRDAVITYTLEARFTDAVTGARVADPIPVGTAFVPGSLTLDGAPLTDGADGDAGRFETGSGQGGAIAVALGPVAAASIHTVQFKAKIQ